MPYNIFLNKSKKFVNMLHRIFVLMAPKNRSPLKHNLYNFFFPWKPDIPIIPGTKNK